jgi:hypothetical protein
VVMVFCKPVTMGVACSQTSTRLDLDDEGAETGKAHDQSLTARRLGVSGWWYGDREARIGCRLQHGGGRCNPKTPPMSSMVTKLACKTRATGR